ncbi:hypothetical protein C2E23DRAFT_551252 [Lenzites betulinus]|nr:hypothetical protein C2E23DRAFT_551252 [Lenzites betulinus]
MQTKPEDPALVENTRTFLEHLARQMPGISENDLRHVTNSLADTRLDALAQINTRRPLLCLPTEILQIILSLIPDAIVTGSKWTLRPIWHMDVKETAMLLPVSRTCKRLREVALGCPALWTSIAADSQPISKMSLQRSRNLPLKCLLQKIISRRRSDDDDDEDPPPMVVEVPESSRIRELQVFTNSTDFLSQLSTCSLPALESLSVQLLDRSPLMSTPTIMLSKEHVPELRRLCLITPTLSPDCHDVLASLTHLALRPRGMSYLLPMIPAILRGCHSLESFHLEIPLGPYKPPNPSPSTSPDISSCPRLRRVCLLRTDNELASSVLSFLPPDRPNLTIQLLSLYYKTEPPSRSITLHHAVPSDISRLSIGWVPSVPKTSSSNTYPWGMTACGSQRVLRASMKSLGELVDLLRPSDSMPLSDTRELWLTDIFYRGRNGVPSPENAAYLRSFIAEMPALETVVLANHFRTFYANDDAMTLHLLPDAREATSRPQITTLRIVFGYGPLAWPDIPKPESNVVVDFANILSELESGAYDYLEHFVLEVPSTAQVNWGHVQALRAYFKTTEVRVTDCPPHMVLPDYYSEPEAWPDARPWPFSLW